MLPGKRWFFGTYLSPPSSQSTNTCTILCLDTSSLEALACLGARLQSVTNVGEISRAGLVACRNLGEFPGIALAAVRTP